MVLAWNIYDRYFKRFKDFSIKILYKNNRKIHCCLCLMTADHCFIYLVLYPSMLSSFDSFCDAFQLHTVLFRRRIQTPSHTITHNNRLKLIKVLITKNNHLNNTDKYANFNKVVKTISELQFFTKNHMHSQKTKHCRTMVKL